MRSSAFSPPSNWARLYRRLEEYRKRLPAPVDTVGCHCLKDDAAPVETQRFQILVALMLSSQTKDQVTAATMHGLMKKGLTVQAVNAMPAEELDAGICKVGFHNRKTKYIKDVAAILIRDYSSTVPLTYAELIALPGVGPKMANLFLQAADGVVHGIGVDTHVHRISQRFGWVPPSVKTPEDTRKALESWLPREHWPSINGHLVGLGQAVCSPLNPKCSICELRDICPNAFQEAKGNRENSKAESATGKSLPPTASRKRKRPP